MLTVCDLSWNGFGEDGGLAIADAMLSNTTLKDLDISNNRLTFPVAAKMAKALITNESLERLKVSCNSKFTFTLNFSTLLANGKY